MPISQVNRWKVSAGTSLFTREINIINFFNDNKLFFYSVIFFLRAERGNIAEGTVCTSLASWRQIGFTLYAWFSDQTDILDQTDFSWGWSN